MTRLRDAAISSRYTLPGAEKRHITLDEIEQAMTSATSEILEDYPQGRRGPSCLVLGVTERGRILHVQVSYPPIVWVVTLYEPDEEKWVDPRTRR